MMHDNEYNPATLHCVRWGETLATLALAYYGDATLAEQIWYANDHEMVDPNHLYAGQLIVIPHLNMVTIHD